MIAAGGRAFSGDEVMSLRVVGASQGGFCRLRGLSRLRVPDGRGDLGFP